MMRALYSSVAGLKTHQTKMDVIGNNIANVNTVGFKSTRVTFATMMYQTTSFASGANAETGRGGVNAKQIGLGATFASTAVSIASGGANESTGNAFDLKISDKSSTSFFIVNNGSENVFTRAGAFYVDGAGNLCMESTGYTVMGWQVDANGNIRKDTVSPLKVMSPENQTSQPEYTRQARCTGLLDDNSANVNSETGYRMNLNFFDNLGYSYTARFAVTKDTGDGYYTVNLTDVIDSTGKSIVSGNKDGLGLSDLFGTGNEGNQQGSRVDITEDYTMATGMASQLKKLANTGTPGENSSKTLEYNYTSSVMNEYLNMELPEGVRVVYSVTTDADGSVTATNVKIIDENGADVTDDYLDYDTTHPEKHVSIVNADGTSPVTDAAAAADIVYTVDIQDILQEWSENDEFEEVVTDSTTTPPTTVQRLTSGQLNELIQTFPDWASTNSITADMDVNVGGTTDAYTLTPEGGTAVIPLTDAVNEHKLGDYDGQSYLTVEASALNEAGIFTTDLPVDVELQYKVGDGSYKIVTSAADGFELKFSTIDGVLEYIGQSGSVSQTLQMSKFTNGNFSDISIDFTSLKNLANSGSSTAALSNGDADGVGKGKKVGAMTGLSVDGSGKVYGTYDNGNTVLLGQIAVARFANASGLESIGDNCFKTTLNSGEFDGIGVEIDADGSSMATGNLEMSNVDLATEFTQMITTQRGYQANSRVISTSDSILEELVNLKR